MSLRVPSREEWAGFERMADQIEQHHVDPDPAGLAWVAVGCLRRVEHLMHPNHRPWLGQVEDCVLRCGSPMPQHLVRIAGYDAFSRGPDPPHYLIAQALCGLVADLDGASPLTGRRLRPVCGAARIAVGQTEFPDKSLYSFPLEPRFETYRNEASIGREPPPQPKERHKVFRGRQDAYHSLREQAAAYQAQTRTAELLEEMAQCELYRCVFGYPFAPVRFDPAWRTAAVVGLAAAVFAGKAFDRLPVLADALEEAGCDDPDVLAHCRGPGPHVRGCWVVEALRPLAAAGAGDES